MGNSVTELEDRNTQILNRAKLLSCDEAKIYLCSNSWDKKYWLLPPNYRLKLAARLFLAERPQLSRSVSRMLKNSCYFAGL
jgi:hypothetical protein